MHIHYKEKEVDIVQENDAFSENSTKETKYTVLNVRAGGGHTYHCAL
jgi:hypothetical protein